MSEHAKPSRKAQILQALAQMLETSPGARITTAALAHTVGVTEAALYRHFPSKARMFDGLIAFVEETVFTRINRILEEHEDAVTRCEKILFLLLSFAEKNPGITRILTGDALTGETERLRARVSQIFDRIEAQLKQILREAQLREQRQTSIPVGAAANLLLATCEGRMVQFVRSEFKRSPLEHWEAQWSLMRADLLVPMEPGADSPWQ